MDNNMVTKLLTDYRSYKFALMNLGGEIEEPKVFLNRPVYNERQPRWVSNYDRTYDRNRYGRIVTMIDSAVDYVLSDDQREIIRRKYMERNTMNLSELAECLHKDRKTVSALHKTAINRLAKALLPLGQEYMEIHNLDFILDTRETA